MTPTERTRLRERIADLQHAQWSGWMEYLFSKCADDGAGGLVIPPWAVARWRRQVVTPYSDLPDGERDSDREEADRVLALLAPA